MIKELKWDLVKLNTEYIVVTFCEWQKKKIPDCAGPFSTKVPMSMMS